MPAEKEQIGGNHYKKLPIQPSRYIYENNIGWLEGNVIKYVTRHESKGKDKDIKKAIHCLKMLLEWKYDEPTD